MQKTHQKRKPKTETVNPDGAYLFNLRVKLAALSPAEKSKVYHYVKKETGYSMRTIMRQKYLKADSPMKPNFEIIAAYAEKLGCTIDQLKNK